MTIPPYPAPKYSEKTAWWRVLGKHPLIPEANSPLGITRIKLNFIPHRIHVCHIFTYIYHKNHPNVARYTSPMDPSWGMNLKPLKTKKWIPDIFHIWNSKAFVERRKQMLEAAKGWWLNLLNSPMSKHILGGGFKDFLFSSRNWGRFPIWLIFFQMSWNHQLV